MKHVKILITFLILSTVLLHTSNADTIYVDPHELGGEGHGYHGLTDHPNHPGFPPKGLPACVEKPLFMNTSKPWIGLTENTIVFEIPLDKINDYDPRFMDTPCNNLCDRPNSIFTIDKPIPGEELNVYVKITDPDGTVKYFYIGDGDNWRDNIDIVDTDGKTKITPKKSWCEKLKDCFKEIMKKLPSKKSLPRLPRFK